MIGTALALAQKGLAVFPCLPRDKRPATLHGVKDATSDPIVIRDWWRQQAQFNVAIATGSISRVFVVDVDGLDAEVELGRLESEHTKLPPTVEAITARGRHVYFKMPEGTVRNSAGKIGPGIDVRGDGGYVLAPPSIHPSGRPYSWSVDSANTFAPAPEWLLALLSAPTDGAGAGPAANEWRELVKGVRQGARDCTAAKLAGYLLRRRIDPFVALQLLQGWNATRCIPPLPEADIERVVASISGIELRRRLHNA